MPTNKKELTISIPEELLEKLEAKAQVAGVAVQDYILLALAECADKPDRPHSLEEALTNLEGLILQNLYWTTLPYQEGLPKSRLNEQGLELYWDKSAAFAQLHCSAASAGDDGDS